MSNSTPTHPRTFPRRHSAAEGMGFALGGTNIYVGPPPTGLGAPILAFVRGGPLTEDVQVVAQFRNATSAEEFIAALQAGIDEIRPPKPASLFAGLDMNASTVIDIDTLQDPNNE